MAVKNSLITHIIKAGDMSADITSDVIETRFLDNLCVQLNRTGGDPTGTFSLLESVDGINYVANVSSIGSVAGSGSAIFESKMYSVSGICSPYVKIMYDRTSGDGELDVWVCGKQI